MWAVLIIFICVGLNAILAGIEVAFVSVNKAMVSHQAKAGSQRAKQLIILRKNPEKSLSTIQIGITLLASLSSAVGGSTAGLKILPFLKASLPISELFAEIIAIIFVVIPITFISVVFGEITPKVLAFRSPYYYATLGTPLLNIISKFFYPAVKLCESSTKILLKLLNKKDRHEFGKKKKTEEYERILTGYQKLTQKGKKYLVNLCKIEEKTIEDILLTWDKVQCVTIDQTLKQIEKTIIESGHTRMPVLEKKKTVGIINSKEILVLLKKGDPNWQKLIHDPIIIKKNTALLQALNILQKNKSHMGIVLDSKKTPLGVVILEDIIEEVFGQIYDEDD